MTSDISDSDSSPLSSSCSDTSSVDRSRSRVILVSTRTAGRSGGGRPDVVSSVSDISSDSDCDLPSTPNTTSSVNANELTNGRLLNNHSAPVSYRSVPKMKYSSSVVNSRISPSDHPIDTRTQTASPLRCCSMKNGQVQSGQKHPVPNDHDSHVDLRRRNSLRQSVVFGDTVRNWVDHSDDPPLPSADVAAVGPVAEDVGSLSTILMNSHRHPNASNVRQIGTVHAVELVKLAEGGFGFTVTTRNTYGGVESPASLIFIKKILPVGAAILDGRLKIGDRLLRLNGEEVMDYSVVTSCLRSRPVGTRVLLEVSRQHQDGETTSADLVSNPAVTPHKVQTHSKLNGHQQQEVRSSVSPAPPAHSASRPTQLTFRIALARTPAESLGLRLNCDRTTTTTPGLHIVGLVAGSPADRDGRLRPGDRITWVNGADLRTMTRADCLQVVQQAASGGPGRFIILTVERAVTSSADSHGEVSSGWSAASEREQKQTSSPLAARLAAASSENGSFRRDACGRQSISTKRHVGHMNPDQLKFYREVWDARRISSQQTDTRGDDRNYCSLPSVAKLRMMRRQQGQQAEQQMLHDRGGQVAETLKSSFLSESSCLGRLGSDVGACSRFLKVYPVEPRRANVPAAVTVNDPYPLVVDRPRETNRLNLPKFRSRPSSQFVSPSHLTDMGILSTAHPDPPASTKRAN